MHSQRTKKICMLGASAVGKTSLVSRLSGAVFSSAYQSTLGVRISRATVAANQRLQELVIWDIKGENTFYSVPSAYFHGCAGGVLVADGTRRSTLEQALDLKARLLDVAGEIPVVLVLNKADLTHAWEIDDATLEALKGGVWTCSVRTGHGIQDALESLALKMWDHR